MTVALNCAMAASKHLFRLKGCGCAFGGQGHFGVCREDPHHVFESFADLTAKTVGVLQCRQTSVQPEARTKNVVCGLRGEITHGREE